MYYKLSVFLSRFCGTFGVISSSLAILQRLLSASNFLESWRVINPEEICSERNGRLLRTSNFRELTLPEI